jgi:TRAP-type mannitol/chloroaromatic compound transport system permease small subunit
MKRLEKLFDSINEFVGTSISWLTTLLVLLISLDVAMRYLLDFTLIWVIELEIYLFAFILLLSAGYALRHERHVRVDVFYSKFSEKGKAWVDLIGTLFFLLPWSAIIIWVGYNYAWMSFIIRERSAQPGGLPALYTLKFLIVLGFVLLMIQGLSLLFQSFRKIANIH